MSSFDLKKQQQFDTHLLKHPHPLALDRLQKRQINIPNKISTVTSHKLLLAN